MTRDQYIAAVKAKLEEVSPFDDPATFVAAGDSAINTIKPIVSYIDAELDKAARHCLMVLPLVLLSKDIAASTTNATVGTDGVGYLGGVQTYWRLVRVKDNGGVWKRDVTAFISAADPLYLLQQNEYTRGGVAKPVVAYNPEEKKIELFSFPKPEEAGTESITLYYIDGAKAAEAVSSDIGEYIVILCAAYVAEILQDTNRAKVLRTEFQEKVAAIEA